MLYNHSWVPIIRVCHWVSRLHVVVLCLSVGWMPIHIFVVCNTFLPFTRHCLRNLRNRFCKELWAITVQRILAPCLCLCLSSAPSPPKLPMKLRPRLGNPEKSPQTPELRHAKCHGNSIPMEFWNPYIPIAGSRNTGADKSKFRYGTAFSTRNFRISDLIPEFRHRAGAPARLIFRIILGFPDRPPGTRFTRNNYHCIISGNVSFSENEIRTFYLWRCVTLIALSTFDVSVLALNDRSWCALSSFRNMVLQLGVILSNFC